MYYTDFTFVLFLESESKKKKIRRQDKTPKSTGYSTWIPYVFRFYDVYLSLFALEDTCNVLLCCENGCMMINEVMEEWHGESLNTTDIKA
jgi:hypothetical protein